MPLHFHIGVLHCSTFFRLTFVDRISLSQDHFLHEFFSSKKTRIFKYIGLILFLYGAGAVCRINDNPSTSKKTLTKSSKPAQNNPLETDIFILCNFIYSFFLNCTCVVVAKVIVKCCACKCNKIPSRPSISINLVKRRR